MKEDFLTSSKATNALSKMRTKECTLEELELTKDEIRELIEVTGNIKYNTSNKTYYITKFNEKNYEIISFASKEKVTEKWLELSDIYFGSTFCEYDTLKYMLDLAKERGYQNVHISGDLCAGHPSYKKQDLYLTAKTAQEQANIAIDLFSKYPEFKYYCINGERDISFEKNGSINPIILVQRDLNEKGIEFHHINEIVANLVIRGVVKRLQHGTGKLAYTKSYKIEKEMWQQFENMSDNVIIKNRNYNIRFVQFGHYHVNCLQELGGIMITSTSGMVFDSKGLLNENTSYPSAKFSEAVICKGKVLKFVTENVTSAKNVIM